MVQVRLKHCHTSGLKLAGASPGLRSCFSHSAPKSLLVGGVQRAMEAHGLIVNAVLVALPTSKWRVDVFSGIDEAHFTSFLVNVKDFRIPELCLLFEDSQFWFPLLLHSGVGLWCSMWRWLPLKQIPWSSGNLLSFMLQWSRWSNLGSEQFENLFCVHFFFEKTIIRLHCRQLFSPPELKAAQFLSEKTHESFCVTNKHFMNYL